MGEDGRQKDRWTETGTEGRETQLGGRWTCPGGSGFHAASPLTRFVRESEDEEREREGDGGGGGRERERKRERARERKRKRKREQEREREGERARKKKERERERATGDKSTQMLMS